MAIIGRFIGVAEYIDPRATELPGARRDATAMWALFSDTLQGADIKLILDKDATASRTREALSETLKAASKKDSVILYFAGHGTPDHRLVVHDTISELLTDTTISFDELSLMFKQSKAKSILCILDCCFSGGIATRVFENAPIPRGPSGTLESFAGEGRVFLAAADFDQPSYELPTTGHGLFTKALLDTLENLDSETDIQIIASMVMANVRAEGTRLGLSQTPVICGTIKGGLNLPVFSRGSNFAKFFPDISGVRIGSDLADLESFSLPKEIIVAWSERLKDGLNKLQLEAINTHRILEGKSLMVVAPTSSGKTFIGEIAAAKAISEGRKVVFLLPYKALVNEKFDYFTELYSSLLGMRVIRCTGDYSDQSRYFIKGKYDIALLTYEMFLGLSVNCTPSLNSIGLVVLDEAQFITDPNRGITVELLLTQLKTSRLKGVSPQLITLSATVGAINSFNEWLDLKVLQTDERPVPLMEGVLDRTGTIQFKSSTGDIQTTSYLPAGQIRIRKKKAESQDLVVPLVKQLIASPTEKIIVFRSNRGSASGCAKYLAEELGLPPASEVIADLPTFDLSGTSTALRTCLMGGTAFHNTDIGREERSLVEQAFRAKDDHVRVLASTTTLAAGINTPASTVILVEHSFPGPTSPPYTVAEYKNMAGRAGRLGFQEEGKAILLADSPSERNALFNKYVIGTPEPITSSFREENTMTWLMKLLAQVRHISRDGAVSLLTNTFHGYLKNRQSPAWVEITRSKLEGLIATLLSHGLLEEQDGHIRLTPLGNTCGESTLSFESVIRMIDLIRKNGSRIDTMEDLVILSQGLSETDERYIPLAKTETQWPYRTADLTAGPLHLLRNYTSDSSVFLRRSKRLSILIQWMRGTPIETIEKSHSPHSFFSVTPGIIRGIADITRFNLRSVFQIGSIVASSQAPNEEDLENCLRQLEVGIPADTLDLLHLPLPLERGEYLHLIQNEIRTCEQYWANPPSTLKRLLGKKAVLLEVNRPLEH